MTTTDKESTEPTGDATETKQLRLALVMNGGVSLAVWMSGVTHEVNSCRLAHDPALTNESRKIWAEILEAANTSVTVDAIAGASAGGLNGTLLAKAVGCGQDLTNMRSLWLDRATISAGKLLAEKPIPAASILDGDYFHEEIESLLNTPVPAVSDATRTPTVTLLVTATALPIADEDEAVAAVVPDSRRVYRFTSRPGVPAGVLGVSDLPEIAPHNDFDSPEKLATLARSARASAGFPSAFQPIRETDELRRHRTGTHESRGRWLMDGGVLDNAPFEPLLDELRRRTVSDRFSRAVVYVNPSTPRVERQNYPSVTTVAQAPGILRTLTAFLQATREPDRRLDVEGLNDALNTMGFSVTDPDAVLARLFTKGKTAITVDQLRTAASALFVQYQSNRRQALLLAAAEPITLEAAPRSVTATADVGPPLVPTDLTLRADGDWHWGLGAADRVLRWWGRALARQKTPSDAQRAKAFRTLGLAQGCLQAWVEALEADATLRAARGDAAAWVAAAEQHLNRNQRPTLIARVLRATANEVAPALGAPSGTALVDASLSLEVVNRALSWRAETSTDVPTFDFWQITPGAPPPFELGLDENQKIEWPHRKLYGNRWANFGAFASESGRTWDWLWGRLDAAMTISGKLLADAEVAPLVVEELQRKLVEAICAEENVNQTEVAGRAQDLLLLTGSSLWSTFRGAMTDTTRTALSSLADQLPGALVPKRLPAPVHAIVDTRDVWREHRPPVGGQAPSWLMLYRGLGIGAQWIVRRKVVRLLRPDHRNS